MPGRQSHGSAPTKKPKSRVNNKKRSINAYAIAEQQYPGKIKIRQHRLGASEGGVRLGKRPKEDEDEDVATSKKARKGVVKGRFDELDLDAGSDSEGNKWRLGEVDRDDDSDLDSDDAFGESDEERFEGFAFSGGSSKNMAPEKKKAPRSKNVTLDEGDPDSDDVSGSDDNLGENAIDLAAMLDATEEDDEKREPARKDDQHSDINPSDGESSGDSEASDEDHSSLSSVEDIDEDESEKAGALQDLITSLPQVDPSSQAPKRQRFDGASEYATPSNYGTVSKKKLTLEDLNLHSIRDAHVKRSFKLLAAESKVGTKSKRLETPLSKREQDRIDRSVAYDKTKETLARWTDTVKHNREAEHLIFPLPNADITSTNNNKLLQHTTNSEPFTNLEATIQSILEESGLAYDDSKDDEAMLMEFENLETNISIEEVKVRRAELRKARDLMFREEARSKRIKKIKSKTYRKVHRKQREKEHRRNKEALAEAGIEPSDNEIEAQDRRRAEERMGARHRGSKWAKETKEIGRSTWDTDAREGITEMARRDEALRKRVEGRTPRIDGADATDSSTSEYSDNDDDETEKVRLRQQLEGLNGTDPVAESGPGSKLNNMRFMLKANAARRKENDAAVERVRKELAGEESSDEKDFDGDIGRRSFGPGSIQAKEVSKTERRHEFEEHEDSDEEADDGLQVSSQKSVPGAKIKPVKRISRREPKNLGFVGTISGADLEGGAWSNIPAPSDAVGRSELRRQKKAMVDVEELDLSNVVTIATKSTKARTESNKLSATKTSTLNIDTSSDEESRNEKNRLPFAIRDQDLIKRAFAGADVVGEFNVEKRQTVKDDEEKVVDNTLPGWGSWIGDGLSKKERGKITGRFLTTVAGINPQDRKDSKLDRVIISEKHVKKNGKYLASTLPHPFETRHQYERSLRLPVGPEWATKEIFQSATKPRILLKQGIITPMSKPLL